MSELSKVKSALMGVQEKLEELAKTSVRQCADPRCQGEIKGADEAFCSDCAAGADCDDCSEEIIQGYCTTCSNSRERSARAVAVGFYPHVGLPRHGAVPDQIISFLRTMIDTCCKIDPRPCPRCDDANYLLLTYAHHLGEVRT
jgi:hypothetical protein